MTVEERSSWVVCDTIKCVLKWVNDKVTLIIRNKYNICYFPGVSLMQFLRTELTRGYQLEHDEERFSARREKVYSFIKIPREVERFMTYGFLQVIIRLLYKGIKIT